MTLTSIYIQYLLRLKSLKKMSNNKHDTESLINSKCHFSYLSFPNICSTRFSSRHCLIKGHRFLKKQYELFISLLNLDPKVLYEVARCLYLKTVGIFCLVLKTTAFFNLLIIEQNHPPCLSYTGYQSPH